MSDKIDRFGGERPNYMPPNGGSRARGPMFPGGLQRVMPSDERDLEHAAHVLYRIWQEEPKGHKCAADCEHSEAGAALDCVNALLAKMAERRRAGEARLLRDVAESAKEQ